MLASKELFLSARKRLVQMIVVLLCISFTTFLLTYLAPGDPAEAMFEAASMIPTEEMLMEARARMGLDKPFLVQYFTWLINCLQGDFGTSFSKSTDVFTLLKQRIWPTAQLALCSLALMMIVSIPLGIMAAVKKNKLLDYLIRAPTFIGISMPGFWIGLILLYVFAYKLALIPVLSINNGWQRLILPSVTLSIAMSAKYIRQVRTAFLEELSQDYVIGARARGITEVQILCRYVLPNAFLPLITMLGLSLGSLLGGTAIVEIVFSYPGLGNLAVSAVNTRDYPLIQGFVLWIAIVYMVINLLVDISYSFVDPRIRKQEGEK